MSWLEIEQGGHDPILWLQAELRRNVRRNAFLPGDSESNYNELTFLQ
jgi:hypothetical protein